MAKLTKRQKIRMVRAIEQKAATLAFDTFNPRVFSANDYLAIEKITQRAMNKLK